MKTKYFLFYLIIILISFFGANKGYSQIVISGYLTNPNGSDSSFEYVQLVATQDIDFSTNPYTLAWCNNGTASVKGWVKGASVTYGFALTSGSVVKGDVFYVGGAMKKINGNGSTDISGAKWIRSIYTGTQNGDGFGTKSTTGNLGNGGSADGIAVFSEPTTNIDSSTVPIDAIFFGDSVGAAKPAAGGYMVANNDRYNSSQGTFGNGTNTYLYANAAASNEYYKLSGTYDLATSTWVIPRTASKVVLTPTSVFADIATAIKFAPVVMINSISTLTTNVVQNSVHNPSYHLVCDVLVFSATLDSIKFKTFGSFKAADIKYYGYKLWYSSNAVYTTSDSLIDSADATGPGDLWFKNPAFQIPVNTTAHFFVTVDISSMATLGDTLYIDSLRLSDVYIASAKKNGANPQARGGVLTVISSTAPIINVTNLNVFSKQVINSTSAIQKYTINGGNLYPASGNIIITPPPGFEISFSIASGFTDSFLTLPYTVGSINPTNVYIVFKPTQIKVYNGNISHIGGNTFQNLSVTGYGISSDTIPPKVLSAYAVNLNTVIVNFDEAVDITAELPKNYVIYNGVASAVRDASLKTVTLTLTFSLTKGIPQSLTVEIISDTCSNHNIMNPPQTFELFIPAELSINELLAKSTSTDDFIEIYNPNLTKSISLKGWHLTNDSSSLLKWPFPDTSITAGGYLVVWDNQHPANPGLHCNFTLNNVAGEIVIRSSFNTTIAYTKFPVPKSDTSWGRMPDGLGAYTYTKPTPGLINKLYPKSYPTYTIAQIRTNNAAGVPDSVDVYCYVTGIVYGVNFSTYGYSFTVIDNTGGINMYKSNTTVTPPYKVKEGDKIKVSGKILPTYYGLTEMGIDSIFKLDSNQTLKSPLLVTVLDETTESNLIRLENLRLVDTIPWPKVAGSIPVYVKAYNSSNDTFKIKIHDKCNLQGTPPPAGKFNIIGIGSQNDNTSPYFQYYEIWPRYKADLEIITDIQPAANNTLVLKLYPNPNTGMFIMDNPSNAKLNISVLNSLGEVISNSVSSQSRISLNITNGKGLFFVKAVATNGQISILKVLVK